MTTKTLVLGFKEYKYFHFYEKKGFFKSKEKSAALNDDNNGHWIDINIDYIALFKDAHTYFNVVLSRVQFSFWFGIFSNM